MKETIFRFCYRSLYSFIYSFIPFFFFIYSFIPIKYIFCSTWIKNCYRGLNSKRDPSKKKKKSFSILSLNSKSWCGFFFAGKNHSFHFAKWSSLHFVRFLSPFSTPLDSVLTAPLRPFLLSPPPPPPFYLLPPPSK